MKKILFVLFLFLSSHWLVAQVKFIDYEEFETLYNQKTPLSILEDKFDLLNLLLLDSTLKEIFINNEKYDF